LDKFQTLNNEVCKSSYLKSRRKTIETPFEQHRKRNVKRKKEAGLPLARGKWVIDTEATDNYSRSFSSKISNHIQNLVQLLLWMVILLLWWERDPFIPPLPHLIQY
jgi:hypothetical protein